MYIYICIHIYVKFAKLPLKVVIWRVLFIILIILLFNKVYIFINVMTEIYLIYIQI